MKVLIGTPIHESKDYSMERWLNNVALILQNSTAKLMLVDNSEDTSYIERVKKYCKKYDVKDYELVHADIDHRPSTLDERLAVSREVIRHEVLGKKYDAWFSWECDILFTLEVFAKLIRLAKTYKIVGHAYPNRFNPKVISAELGITLINRKVLEEFSFLDNYGHVDPINPNCAYGGDVWFCVWARRKYGRKYTHVYKTNEQIYHLNE